MSPSSSVSHYDTVPTVVAKTPIQASIAGTTGVEAAAAWSTVPAVNPHPSVVDGDEDEAHEGDDLFEEQPGLVELMLVDIPPSFVGHLYIEVVREVLLNYSWVPLGLYRGKETHDSPLPYVFTNPPPSTVIGPGDTLYVIILDYVSRGLRFLYFSFLTFFGLLAVWHVGFLILVPWKTGFNACRLFGFSDYLALRILAFCFDVLYVWLLTFFSSHFVLPSYSMYLAGTQSSTRGSKPSSRSCRR
jgi:hypothetical protein